MNEAIHIYTDGACSGNPGPGGWGAVLRWRNHERRLSGAEEHTTNNRMELQAAIAALSAIKRPVPIHLYTDSQYVHKGITEWLPRWKASGWQAVANRDLWEQLDALARRLPVTWHWVRGHSGVEGSQLPRPKGRSLLRSKLG